MPHPLLNFRLSDYLIQVVYTNSHTLQQTVQIQISWLLKKPTDLDLYCFAKAAGLGLRKILRYVLDT